MRIEITRSGRSGNALICKHPNEGAATTSADILASYDTSWPLVEQDMGLGEVFSNVLLAGSLQPLP